MKTGAGGGGSLYSRWADEPSAAAAASVDWSAVPPSADPARSVRRGAARGRRKRAQVESFLAILYASAALRSSLRDGDGSTKPTATPTHPRAATASESRWSISGAGPEISSSLSRRSTLRDVRGRGREPAFDRGSSSRAREGGAFAKRLGRDGFDRVVPGSRVRRRARASRLRRGNGRGDDAGAGAERRVRGRAVLRRQAQGRGAAEHRGSETGRERECERRFRRRRRRGGSVFRDSSSLGVDARAGAAPGVPRPRRRRGLERPRRRPRGGGGRVPREASARRESRGWRRTARRAPPRPGSACGS